MYHFSHDRLVPAKENPGPANVDGPFYVTNQCIICGLPPETAPKNINIFEGDAGCTINCRLFKQPENDEELESVIQAMLGSCVAAVRYRGTDKSVLDRLSKLHLEFLCDAKT